MRLRAATQGYFVPILAAFFTLGVLRAETCRTENQIGAVPNSEAEFLTEAGEIGARGGTLVISQRSEPKTFNPLIALDGGSREVIGLLMADLVHINRYTQQAEPALAKSWTVSPDRRQYTLHLRRGLFFSDHYPFNADDVVFTFEAYLDERTRAPQRDLLVIGGKPISVRKLDTYTVAFSLAQPDAAAERLFDSIAILPRHLLEQAYEEGKLASVWNVSTLPVQIAGLGPFQLKQYIPGQRIILQRNALYWKKDTHGNRLPYVDEIVFLLNVGAEADVMRFEAGETDIISRFNPADFALLARDERQRKFRIYDAGPGLEYSFLLFNLNNLKTGESTSIAEKQKWFLQVAFRQAISDAIDREAIVRLAYSARAYPLTVPISPGDKLWFDSTVPKPSRSIVHARQLLREAGFSWKENGALTDPLGKPVEFSIMHNAGRIQQQQMGTIIQQDLKDIGIKVNLIPLDFTTLVDRIFASFTYEAAIMTLADGDSDPNSEMAVWLSKGSEHVWRLRSSGSPEEWQQEIDRLMEEQMITSDYPRRKEIFDHVQHVIWEHQPVIFLVSPDVLVGARDRVGNFRPAVIASYTLWNADQLFIRGIQGASPR